MEDCSVGSTGPGTGHPLPRPPCHTWAPKHKTPDDASSSISSLLRAGEEQSVPGSTGGALAFSDVVRKGSGQETGQVPCQASCSL